MAVVKYFIGGILVFGLIVFAIKQVKFVIDVLRKRRNSKSSDEQKDESAKSPSEVSEKEVKQ